MPSQSSLDSSSCSSITKTYFTSTPDSIPEYPENTGRSRTHSRTIRNKHGYLQSLIIPSSPVSEASADNNQQSPSPPSGISPTSTPQLQRIQPVFSPVRKTRPVSIPAGSKPRVHSFDMAISAIDSRTDDMRPDSPPDLSSSKSSKSSSSSFRSSSFSEATGSDIVTHFEDISLNEAKRDSYDLHAHQKRPMRPSPRPLHSVANARRKGMHTVDNGQGFPMARRSLPTSQGLPNGVLQEASTNIPVKRSPRQGLRHASSSSAIPHLSSERRSPSPAKSFTSNSSRSGSSNTNISPNTAPAPRGFFSRTQSRKTTKEVEADYDDLDEDIPEDAMIWNVPLTPAPFASRDPSPHHKASQSSLQSVDGPSATENAPTSSARRTRSSLGSQQRMPALPRSATVASFPSDFHQPLTVRDRHKSWQADLSDDARAVAMALEAYAASAAENATSTDEKAARPAKGRSKTSTVEMPPIQKNNIMIDPLPMSREKEAVLARTRPSWLPPKCRKEEKRHMKEWEKMMAYALEADKRRAAKQLEEIETRRESKTSIERLWEDHVLPNWDSMMAEPHTRELWWQGVTPKNRGAVWVRAIGNDLELNEASYTCALNRSKAVSDKFSAMSGEEISKSKEAAWHSAIVRDVPTVFPELGIFACGSPLHDSLKDVLCAYTAYRSDVGYVYGVHLIAGLLVINSTPAEAFIALANILNRPLPLAYLVQDRAAIDRWQSMVLTTLKHKIPALHEHLTSEKLGLCASEWLEPMLSTLFTRHADPDTASRIWDVYVFENDKILIRTVVGLLSRLESRLYGSKEEVLSILGWEADAAVWKGIGTEDEVMRAVREAGRMSGSDNIERRK
ncbi:hypothetical protein MBLNU457_g2996t2 [Dothideomycetes sp. NU457]